MAAIGMKCIQNECICAYCRTHCVTDDTHPACNFKSVCATKCKITTCPNRSQMTRTEMNEIYKKLSNS